MEFYVAEWLNLLVRWLHVTAGIAWIGASFYFIWLDNNLEPSKSGNPRIHGELWSVHGGGFYHNQKYLLGPERLPDNLHWFKWEAYTTWLSGFALLVIVYWHGARTYLIDPGVADIGVPAAIAISAASMALGWAVYDSLCRTRLVAHEFAFGVVCYALTVAVAWALGEVLSGRAAYLHVGAMWGTIMVANVLFVIIPGQRRVVAALRAGLPPDPLDGLRGKQRSVHNNYITLPVLFIMVSNHYPMTYGHGHGWAVLAVIVMAGVLVRHFFNLRHKGRIVVALPVAAAMLIAALFFTMAPPPAATVAKGDVSFDQVRAVINERCVACHAAKPSQQGITAPPAGVILETPAQLRRWSVKIHEQAVLRRTMPAANATGMSDEERGVLAAWVAAGAPVE